MEGQYVAFFKREIIAIAKFRGTNKKISRGFQGPTNGEFKKRNKSRNLDGLKQV